VGEKSPHTVTSKHLHAAVLVLALMRNLRPYDHYNLVTSVAIRFQLHCLFI